MKSTFIDQLIIKDHALYMEDAFGETYPLPNLTGLWQLYKATENSAVKNNIRAILEEDLGTLLIAEIMIDPSHEVTLKRLETGEIQKNMKHVHDYYIIPKSHCALAQQQYAALHKDQSFDSCHFSTFPYGLAIVKAGFPEYVNTCTSTEALKSVL